jgi:hypothetical protein
MRTARKAIPRPASRQTKSVLGPEGASRPPAFRPVQLATLVDAMPAGDRWIHEMKYDGYRILVAVGGGEARAYTRSGLDWSDRFPSILSETSKLKGYGARSGYDVRTRCIRGYTERRQGVSPGRLRHETETARF